MMGGKKGIKEKQVPANNTTIDDEKRKEKVLKQLSNSLELSNSLIARKSLRKLLNDYFTVDENGNFEVKDSDISLIEKEDEFYVDVNKNTLFIYKKINGINKLDGVCIQRNNSKKNGNTIWFDVSLVHKNNSEDKNINIDKNIGRFLFNINKEKGFSRCPPKWLPELYN